jgi:hypothetical protein
VNTIENAYDRFRVPVILPVISFVRVFPVLSGKRPFSSVTVHDTEVVMPSACTGVVHPNEIDVPKYVTASLCAPLVPSLNGPVLALTANEYMFALKAWTAILYVFPLTPVVHT